MVKNVLMLHINNDKVLLAARLKQLGYVEFSCFVSVHRPTTPKLFSNVSPAKGMVDEFFGTFGLGQLFFPYTEAELFFPK